MAEIIPIIINDMSELSQAIKLERTAILVKNEELYDVLQEREQKSNRRKKISKIGKGASAVTGVASFVAALFGPVGIFVASTYALTASLFALGGSSLLGVSKNELDKYKVVLYENGKLLVLVKVKGKNAAKKNDTVKLPHDFEKKEESKHG